MRSLLPGAESALSLAGANPDDAYARGVLEYATHRLGEERFRSIPQFPFDELAKWSPSPT